MPQPPQIAANEPPYTPGFGVVPEVLAGREQQLARHERALLSGPRDPFFTQAIIGERGVGKTVFLSVLADRMHDQHDWIVLGYQARKNTEALSEILTELPDAAGRTWKGRGLRGLQKQVSVEVNAGIVKVSGSATADPSVDQRSIPMALARALRVLGQSAQQRGRGVMIAIDEAQSLSEQNLSELGMIAQTVAHASHLPVAITVAGTPDLSASLLKSGSFLERMPRTELGMLSVDETRLALLEPANARGVTWDQEALTAVQNSTGGYPYFVQLAGYHAWQHAAPGVQGQITGADAIAAAKAVQHDADRMFRERWDRLGPAQREYLRAVAQLQWDDARRGPVATRSIAARVGKSATDLSRVRDTLVNDHHLLRSAARGEVQFAIPRFAAWLEERELPRNEPAPEPPATRGLPQPGGSSRRTLPPASGAGATPQLPPGAEIDSKSFGIEL